MTAARAPSFRILGPMAVTVDGRAVDVGSPKQRAVLALMLINPNRSLTADEMIDELWDEQPPDSAVATLQAYISNLRRVLEPTRQARVPSRVILSMGGGYQIVTDPQRLDTLRFEEHLASAGDLIDVDAPAARREAAAALALWRGPALAEFRYEAFAQAEIRRLEEMRLAAAELRISADLALGRAEELIPELEQLVAANPLRERLWAHLMLALYRSDRQADALRAYRRCEHALAEVGLSPGSALQRLEIGLLSQDPSLARPERNRGRLHTGGDESAPRPDGVGQMAGRESERAEARVALDEAAAGRGTVVILEGEAGIGKTKFIEALGHDAGHAGFRTAIARCVEVGGTPPFWPWQQLIRQIGADEVIAAAGGDAGYLAPVLPAGFESGPPAPTPLHRVATGLSAALNRLGRETPLLLVIDDISSADPDSLSLFVLIAGELSEAAVMLLASHRGRDLGSRHPLTRTLGALGRLGGVRRITLDRLDFDDISAIVAAVAGPVDPGTLQTIFHRTEGNPFFAVELTKLLLTGDSLSSDAAASAVPSTVLEVVAGRLSQLSAEALALTRAAAVYGREFEVAVAADAAELTIAQSLDALDEVMQTGLIGEADRPGIYRFSHMIVVNTVTQALGSMRRAYLHGRIADALEAKQSADEASTDIAHHRVQAQPIRGASDAIRALRRAGLHAIRTSAYALAEDLLQQRLQLVTADPPSSLRDSKEVTALLDLAPVWTWQEGFHSSQLRSAADRLWDLTGIASDRIQFDPSRPVVADDPVLGSFQARFSVEIVSGDITAAERVSRRLMQVAAANDDPMVTFAANQTLLTVAVHAGLVKEAVAAADRAAAALEILDPNHTNALMMPLGQQPARLTFHSFAGWAHCLDGNPERARRELSASRILCEQLANPLLSAFVATLEGIVAAMEGDPHRVAEILEWSEPGRDGELFGLVDQWRQLFRLWAEGMLGSDSGAAASGMMAILDELAADGAEVSHTLYCSLAGELQLKAGNAGAALAAAQRGIARVHASGERYWYPGLELIAAAAYREMGDSEAQREAMRRACQAALETGAVPVLRRLESSARA